MLSTWLPPLWLIGAGAGLGLLILAVAWGITAAISRRAALELWEVAREGFLIPVLGLALFLAGFALVASFETPVRDLFRSLVHLGDIQTFDDEHLKIEPGKPQTLEFTARPDELQSVTISTDQPLVLRPLGAVPAGHDDESTVAQQQTWSWKKGTGGREKFVTSGGQAGLVLRTPSDQPAIVHLHYEISPDYPESKVIPGTALALVLLVGGYLAFRLLLPKTAAVAQTTAKEAVAQPLFYLALAIGAFALVVFIYIPYFTLGEDVKMLKESGLQLIMVLAIGVALWTASISVADEIEGRTALTVLSKPLGRRQFVIGKFIGILVPVVFLFLFLGMLLLATVSYKVVFDSREGGTMDINWQNCYAEMISVVPGLVLAFFEAVVLAAISVAISTRLPMLPNLVICGSIYVLGNLVPMIGNSKAGEFEVAKVPVKFVAQFFATVLPVLEHFNIQAAVAGGRWVPMEYLAWAALYCLLYSSLAMLLALFLFEDRDLA